MFGLPGQSHEFIHFFFSVLFTGVVVAGCRVIAASGAPRVAPWTLGTAAVAARWISYASPLSAAHVADAVFSLAFFAVFFVFLGKRVFDRRDVTGGKIKGAVAMYILLALIGGRLYTLAELLSPGSMLVQPAPDCFMMLHRELTYFSFMTITTTGYGDIAPVHPFVRSIAALESCIGVLFPNILIARLVSLEIMHSRKGSED